MNDKQDARIVYADIMHTALKLSASAGEIEQLRR